MSKVFSYYAVDQDGTILFSQRGDQRSFESAKKLLKDGQSLKLGRAHPQTHCEVNGRLCEMKPVSLTMVDRSVEVPGTIQFRVDEECELIVRGQRVELQPGDHVIEINRVGDYRVVLRKRGRKTQIIRVRGTDRSTPIRLR